MTAVPLKSLCQIRHGGTPSKANAAYWVGSIPWVSPKDMKSATLSDASDHISQEAVKNSATSVVPEKSILIVVRSGILAHSLPVAQAAKPLAFNQDIKALTPDDAKIDPDYLFWFVRSQEPRVLAQGVKKGATVHSLQSGFIENLQVPLPERAEQRRIVDLLSRAEGIVRLRREAEKKAAELIPALFLDMFGDPEANPKGWPIQSLKNLVSFVSGGTPSKSREDFWEGDLPWVSPKDMKRVGIDSAFDHVNRKVLTETAIKLIPVGSVLVVVRGMILVHTVPVAQSLVPMTINQDMKALVPIQSVNGTYLLWSLRVRQGQLLSLVTTAAHGTKKMETERLEAFSISLPPLAAQEDFAGKLASIESIQSQQSAATAKAQATFDALLAQALAAD